MIFIKKLLLIAIVLAPVMSFSQHTLQLKSGEKHTGEAISLKDGIITFSSGGTTNTYKVADVRSLQFSESKPVAEASGSKGVSYVMNGRKLTRQPVVNNLTMEKGIVVVEITINKYGNVVKAEPGAEGTTTTSQYLLTKAKQAAESVSFDSQPTSPLEQKGTITITF